MVFSVKANRNKIIAVMILVCVIILGVIFLPSMTKEPVKIMGGTPDERTEFLSSFGWQISEDPIDQREVIIPDEFSEIYQTYNVMQLAQGFDLIPYKGVQCTQYIYRVENYPLDGKEVHATLLVHEGFIIGGDISCAEIDGFMHGFAKDSMHFGDDGNSSDTEPSTSSAITESESSSSEPAEAQDTADATQTTADTSTESDDATEPTTTEVSQSVEYPTD